MKQHVSNKVAWMVVALLIPQVALAGGFVNRTKECTGEDEIGETSASFGDLNGDGYVDLSTALSLFVNVQGKSYKRIGMGVTLIWGDVNNDGHLDYVTVPGSGALMLGDGKGGFQLGVRPPGPFGAECIAASFGDINNDGLLDIYYGVGYGSQDTLWRQAPESE